jgi:hypothetical protein
VNGERLTSLAILLAVTMITIAGSDHTAHAGGLYTVEVEHSNTSDHINLNTLSFNYINNQRQYFWPYKEAADSKWDSGIQIQRHSGQADGTGFIGQQFEGLLDWNYSEYTYIRGRLGGHQLKVSNLDEKQRFSYDMEAHAKLSPFISLNFDSADDYVYQLGLQPGGVREFLHARKNRAGLSWTPEERFRLTASTSLWHLSDGNVRRQNKVDLLYGISMDWPWLWAGASYEVLHYDKEKSDYWTPGKFRATGLVFEGSFPVTEGYTGALSINISKIKENSYPAGNSNSLFAGLDHKLNQDYTLRIGFSRIRSQQESSNWTENTYRLSINRLF